MRVHMLLFRAGRVAAIASSCGKKLKVGRLKRCGPSDTDLVAEVGLDWASYGLNDARALDRGDIERIEVVKLPREVARDHQVASFLLVSRLLDVPRSSGA